MIENFDELLCYTLYYPVEDWVRTQYKKHKKHKDFDFFLLSFTESWLKRGIRLFGEFEQEWGQLWQHYIEQREKFENKENIPHFNFYILLDNALLLEHEGHNIPNLLR